jgi:hypothetical protein
MFRLFLYGTLLDPARFAAVAGRAAPLRAGRAALLYHLPLIRTHAPNRALRWT